MAGSGGGHQPMPVIREAPALAFQEVTVDWTQAAADLRAHARQHVDHMTAVTGHPHRMDPAYYRLAAQCDAAAYSPTVPKPKLEAMVRAALGATPVAVRFGGNFDLSAGTGV